MTTNELKSLVGKNVLVFFDDNSNVRGVLEYLENGFSKNDSHSSDTFCVGNTPLDLSKVRKLISNFDNE